MVGPLESLDLVIRAAGGVHVLQAV